MPTTAASLPPEDSGTVRTPGNVVVLGSANADLVIALERRPAAGETVIGGDLVVSPGGKGANQAVAAGRLGARVSFVGCVGDDDHGRLIRSSLRSAGVDPAGLRTGSAPTGTAVVLVTPDGDNSIVVSPGANAELGLDDVEAERDRLSRARVLVLQREVDADVSAAAAAITDSAGGRVLLSLAPSGAVPPFAAAARRSGAGQRAGGPGPDPGHRRVRGRDTARRPARRSRAGGGGAGHRGPLGRRHPGRRRGRGRRPPRRVRNTAPVVPVVDTTGAGDALAGALAWRLAAGDDLATALPVAVRVAALSVTRPGAQPSYPSAADLNPG